MSSRTLDIHCQNTGDIGKSYTGIVYLNVSSVILYNKLIEARMFPEKYVQGISVAVLYGITHSLLGYGYE